MRGSLGCQCVELAVMCMPARSGAGSWGAVCGCGKEQRLTNKVQNLKDL